MIDECYLALACKQTTGVGDPTPNAHRVLCWLLNNKYVEGCFSSDDFQQVATYVHEHYGVKPKTALWTESDPLLPRDSRPRLYPRNRQHHVLRPKTNFNRLFMKK